MTHAVRPRSQLDDGHLMRCYCGQSQPGVGSGFRYTDLLITVHGTYKETRNG